MAHNSSSHPAQKRYPPELRERAVRMVLETMEQTGQRVGVITRIARQLGIGAESLRGWVRQAEVDGGRRPGVPTAEQQRIAELEREVRELRRANEILKAASAFFARELDAHRDRFGVEPICRTLQVAPSSYYAHKARPPSARAVADEQLKVEIRRVWDDNFQVYGAEKLWRQLGREAIQIGRDRVARLMRTLGIRGSCAAPSGPPPPPPMLTSAPPTSSTATSPRRRPTACGSPTSPTCPPGRDSATPRSSSTPTAAPSWAGGSRPPCGPPWPWTPWRWPSGPARTPAWRRWCITPTAACST